MHMEITDEDRSLSGSLDVSNVAANDSLSYLQF